ncbi:MAG TPA: glycosyltransferase [Thermoleophilaceae bacterium]|nr:glycosyltransferase [Thermoleophilaceae bacterium]
MSRPSVDVVVPFKGGPRSLRAVRERLGAIELRPGDSVLVVDNTSGAPAPPEGGVPVLRAAELPTPAFARNRGAERGSAEWLVFCDADTRPDPAVLDRYFEPEPAPRTGLLAGGVIEQEAPPGSPVVARYSYLRGAMTQDDTFSFGEWGYPKSANIACRRTAFEEVGGFREGIRAAEDADLTYRLRAAGWELERRERAAVVHASRKTLRGFVTQKAVWGAGGEWISRAYPGSVPLLARTSFWRWALSATAGALAELLRGADRDAVILAFFRPLEAVAWELGRLLPNERPVPESSPWRRVLR